MEGSEVMELLLDISSRLQATEQYIEVWDQAERGRTQGASIVIAATDRTAMELMTTTTS